MLINTAGILLDALMAMFSTEKDKFLLTDEKEIVKNDSEGKVFSSKNGYYKSIKEYIFSTYRADSFIRKVKTDTAGIIYQEMFVFADNTKIFVTIDTRGDCFRYQFYMDSKNRSDTSGYHYTMISSFINKDIDEISLTEFK